MLVSVIIPNYNHARYLKQRIDSVLSQTIQNFEVIILDDCSTDNSLEVIQQFAAQDSRIRVVYNDQNSGSTFKQWNKGLRLAKGEFIWIAESDDYADPRLLGTLVAALQEDNGVGLAYCDSWHVYEDKGSVERDDEFFKELDPVLWTQNFTVEGITLIRKFMSYRNIIPNASAVVLRRSIVQQVASAKEDMKLNSDWLYWASILAISKVSFIAEPLNYYRHHNRNVRSTTLINGTAFVEITHVLLSIKQYGNPDKFFFNKIIDHILNMWFNGMLEYEIPMKRHYIIYNNLIRADKNFKHLFLKKFRQFFLANKFSRLRQLLGDKMLYPFLKRLTKMTIVI